MENLKLNKLALLSENNKHYYVDEHIFIAMNAQDFVLKHLRKEHPYRVDEGRLVLVTNCWVRVLINLEEVYLTSKMIIVLIPNGIFEVLDWSPDFDIQFFTFKELPLLNPLNYHLVVTLEEKESMLVREYIHLIWHDLHFQPIIIEKITFIQTALLLEIMRIANMDKKVYPQKETRQTNVFRNFLNLLYNYGLTERKVEFYADKLCVTPNHLGAIIRKVSGLTVMQWINRYTIEKAKMLLRYSDFPIYEISTKMNFPNASFFSKFFKQHTGKKPLEYRNNKK